MSESPESGSPERHGLAEQPPKPAFVWGMGEAAVVVALAAAVLLACGLLGVRLAQRSAGPVGLAAVLAFAYLLAIGVPWLRARMRGSTLGEATLLRPAPIGPVFAIALATAIAGRVAVAVWVGVLGLFHVRLPGADADPSKLFGSGASGLLLALAVVAIVAPLAEEIVFRGVLLRAIEAASGERVALVVSSVAFSLVHLTPFAMPPIFVFALMLGVVYTRTRTLWTPVLAHALFNAIGVIGVYALRWAGYV